MHRRSGQASGIMPTSGIYAGTTTFASTLPLSSSSRLYSTFLLSVHRIDSFPSIPRPVLSIFFPLSTFPSDREAHGPRALASLPFHYRRSMECIGLSQHLRERNRCDSVPISSGGSRSSSLMCTELDLEVDCGDI